MTRDNLDWNQILPIVDCILGQETKSGDNCFLSCYQIAVLVDKVDSSLRGNLPIGGKGAGCENSFSSRIAKKLKSESGRYEMRYFSKVGLHKFEFIDEEDNVRTSSEDRFSMFRLRADGQCR